MSKAKKMERLRTQYNNAKNKLNNAPAEIKATRKAYFIEDPSKGAQLLCSIYGKRI